MKIRVLLAGVLPALFILSCAGVGGKPGVKAYHDHTTEGFYLEGMRHLLGEAGLKTRYIDRNLGAGSVKSGGSYRSHTGRLLAESNTMEKKDPMAAAEAMLALGLFERAAGDAVAAKKHFSRAVTLYGKALRFRYLVMNPFIILKQAECNRALAVALWYLGQSRSSAWRLSRAVSMAGTGSRFRGIRGEKSRLFASLYLERLAVTMAAFNGPESNAKRQPSRDFFRSGKVMESAASLAPVSYSSGLLGKHYRYRAPRVWIRTGKLYEEFAEAAVKLHETSSGIFFLKTAARMYAKSIALSGSGKKAENASLATKADSCRKRAVNRRKRLGG